MSDVNKTTEPAPACECGGPPCRVCPELACRYMTRNEWMRLMLDRMEERQNAE